MVTAYTHSKDKELCFKSEADEFLAKPINREELYLNLKKYNLI